jgi:hypothetical protein
MKTSRAHLATVLVLTMVCTTVFTGCAHVKGSPAPGPYSGAVKAAAGISTGLNAVQQQNEILYTTIVNSTGKRLLSRDESLAVANGVLIGFQANDAFISCLKGFKVVGSTDAQIISDCFKNLASTLNKIQAGIIANVKDPAAHNALTLAFNSVIDAANIVGQILATQLLTPAPQVSEPGPSSNFVPKQTTSIMFPKLVHAKVRAA